MTGAGNHQLTTYLAELSEKKDATWILQKKREYDGIVLQGSQPTAGRLVGAADWNDRTSSGCESAIADVAARRSATYLFSPPTWHTLERFGALSFIQAIAVEPEIAREFFDGEEQSTKYDELFASDIEYDWDEILRRLNFLYDDLEEILLIPSWERRLRALTRFEQRIIGYGKRSVNSEDTPEQQAADFLSHLFAIHTSAVIWASARIEWDSRATSIAFALAAYRADNDGESPDTLEQLVPKYLDSVPDSPFTDKPRRYIKRQNDVLIANDDTFALDGSEEALEKLIADAKPGSRVFPTARSFVMVVSKR
jgi:hypothetical protein